ncbi:MAG TPA: hypothetical protein VFM35_11885 [Candidatus Binatia bacterium]|nr:hypothetical protein [Candidatus Binatia bacterium]
MKRLVLFLALTSLSHWTNSALADYTLILKNGRRITVQSYREEGSMIKIQGLGGEFGIPKDQIQTILKAGQSQQPGLRISDLEASARPSSAPPQEPAPTSSRDVAQPSGQETKPAVNDEEEKEYQKRLAEVTQKLEAAQKEYFDATQGGGASTNVTKEGIQAWTADLGSRIRDSQKVPGGGGPSDTPPMPPYAPTYTPREKKISDLRAQVDTLQKERDSLIQEMKSKNIPTGTP